MSKKTTQVPDKEQECQRCLEYYDDLKDSKASWAEREHNLLLKIDELKAKLAGEAKPKQCQHGTTCNGYAIDDSSFCFDHKCETKGCNNHRDKAFHHCEIHP